ncbi:uncharacterized protein ARMOST_22117 [Armillaria ostoyae]|uniref:Uncharacterized protein n=1 Tax=Armillaria ostoyae TaxID=47428 RepID=A0A284SBZ3_ARMOS|nr:uncharacterized protein ARMOST_22117 [Armillaria ostoyae]
MSKRCVACGKGYKTNAEHDWRYHQCLYPVYIIDAPPQMGLVPLTWTQVTRNMLNGLMCLDKDCTHKKRFSFIDMVQYTKHLIESHPYIRTSFTENVLHVQEPTNFGNPDIPVSCSVQYSHHMSEDQPPIPPTSSSSHFQPPTDPIDATLIFETPPDMADNVFLPYISPKISDDSFIPYIPPEIVPVPSKSTVIPYGHSVQSPSNVSYLKLPAHPPVTAIPSVPNTRLRACRPATAIPTVSNTRCPVLRPCAPVLAIPAVPRKACNILLVHLPKEVAGKFHTYTQPSPPKVVEEPLDDTSPRGPLSLGTHHHDNPMLRNNSFAPTMDGDGDVAMLPPLGLSSLGQEAHYPDPQDNLTLDNPYVEESGSNCILVTRTLTRFNLFLHSQYRTIHCRNKIGSEECNTAQLPYAVAGHLQSQHQYVFNKKEKKDLKAYIMTLKPVTNRYTFVNPKPSLAPVKGLKMEKGFCCKKCSYASNDHRGQAHYIPVAERRQEGWVQHFFIAPIRYFSVEPSSAKRSNTGEEDPFTIFLKTVVPAIENESIQVLPDAIWPREVPPLVKMMGWHLHLADYITDRHKVQNLRTLVESPPKRVKGSIPDLIYQAVFGYLDAIGELHRGLTVLEKKLLFNPDDPSQRFTMHDESATQRDYGHLLFVFVYAILTSRTSSITDYRFPLTTSDDKNAKRLMKVIKNKRSKLEASEDLHSFLVPLFLPCPSTQDKWDIPIDRTTQVYAKFKYLIRCTCLFEANKRRADFDDNLYPAIKHYAKHMLSSESGTSPYALVTEAQGFASGLVFSQPSPPTTHVSADGLTIFHKATMFHIPSWRAGLHQMMDFVIASQDLLIGEADSFTIPDFIPDDWGKESRGYSWLDNADFGVHSYALVKNLMADPSNVSVGEDGSLMYNFPKLEKLLSDIGEIT